MPIVQFALILWSSPCKWNVDTIFAKLAHSNYLIKTSLKRNVRSATKKHDYSSNDSSKSNWTLIDRVRHNYFINIQRNGRKEHKTSLMLTKTFSNTKINISTSRLNFHRKKECQWWRATFGSVQRYSLMSNMNCCLYCNANGLKRHSTFGPTQ